ncbi:MAG: hypothetical protein AYK18_17735 [Theionarchaea archaeon DG-70]|nr:MAG: hypothetical protein AYK18_17735 [Theionarchaea archaeon DG-70]
MKRTGLLIIALLLVFHLNSGQVFWTHTARIAGGILWTDMTEEEMRETITHIHEKGQSVILTWVPHPLLEDWSPHLEFLKNASQYIHRNYPEMALIIYQGPLEIVTFDVDVNRDGKVDYGKTSINTEHPEWLQVGIDGRKAVFYGDVAFWVGSTDEDVWLCPNDPEYRELVKSHFLELAQTGIDGIWVDIPKFQCDFGDWDSNWACHCEDCQKKFREDTGLNIPQAIDWNDITWKIWVLWRQNVIADYIKELNEVVKSANPECQLIVEHWHGIDVGSVRSAWSPVLLREVTDCLAHEYPAASYDSSTYDYYNYLRDMACYLYYRGLDKEHPSWILAYSSDENGQRMLAASLLTAGCNFYDTDAPHMDGIVSAYQQAEIFQWITKYLPYYYGLHSWSNVGVYYSKATMDFMYHKQWGEGDFYCEFMGISMMLLSAHIPYTVIFSLDNLEQFHTLILPNTACMSEEEIETINQFIKKGGTVLATGDTGKYDEWGKKRSADLLHSEVIEILELLGAHYYRDVQPYNVWWIPPERGNGEEYMRKFLEILERLEIPAVFEISAPKGVIILPFRSGNKLIFRVLNLSEISKGEPQSQEVFVNVLWSVENGNLYHFLSASEEIGNPAAFDVYDHAILVYDLDEPVTVISNLFDRATADFLVTSLEKEGFLVEYSTACPSCMERLKERKQLIILGGHKAQHTGTLVDDILTEEEKRLLEVEGAQYIFVKTDAFSEGQTIIIIAGNEREDTLDVVEKKAGEILKSLEKLSAGYLGFTRFSRI